MRSLTFTLLCALLSACPPPTPSGGGGSRSGDGGAGTSESILGTWRADSTDAGTPLHLAFRDDGILLVLTDLATCSERERMGYTTQDQVLTVEQDVEPVPFRFEDRALILATEDGEQRFVRAAEDCHTIAPSVSVVGTWEVVDSERPDGTEALVFTENGLLFFISDLSECTPSTRYPYNTEGDQLTVLFSGDAQTDTYTIDDDVLTITNSVTANSDSFTRSRTDCHTRLQAGGELPAVLIGTFSHDQMGFAIRTDQTISQLTDVEACTVEDTKSVYRYDDVLLIVGEGAFRWEQRGADIALTPIGEAGETVLLTRTEADCHQLP